MKVQASIMIATLAVLTTTGMVRANDTCHPLDARGVVYERNGAAENMSTYTFSGPAGEAFCLTIRPPAKGSPAQTLGVVMTRESSGVFIRYDAIPPIPIDNEDKG